MRMLSPLERNAMWPTRSAWSSDVWDDFFSDFDRMVDSIMRPLAATSTFSLAGDVQETEDHYLLSFDLPGVRKQDLKVEIKDHQLMISGERRDKKFQRIFTLPATINADKVEAHYEDGVLNIALPKTEKAKGRRIEIQSGKSGGLFSRLLNAGKKDADRVEREVKEAQAS